MKTKSLNENLAPLRRYLRAQVNRPWSKVYAEICAHLRPRSTVQQHVRDHVEDFVAFRTRMKAGAVYVTGWGWRGFERPLAEDQRELFVHPRTGLLLRNPNAGRLRASFRAKDDNPKVCRLGPFRIAVKLSGVWFEANLEPVPEAPPQTGAGQVRPQPFLDAIVGEKWSRDYARTRYGRPDVFAETLRRLNAAERKRHALD